MLAAELFGGLEALALIAPIAGRLASRVGLLALLAVLVSRSLAARVGPLSAAAVLAIC
jgi:hypothetical protein